MGGWWFLCVLLSLQVVSAGSSQLKCSLGFQMCKDGSECIPYDHVCDGDADCKDGSDEEGCELTCKKDQFQCAHGKKCLAKEQVCDGEPQCQDRSDEMNCRSKSDDCVHSCDGRCLPASFVCDGEVDCLDRSDEANCEDQDEKGTSATTVLTPTPAAGPPKPLKCSLGSKPCRDNSDCILHDHVCDGEADCRDGSDEDDCQTECGKDQFQCAHGKKCLAKEQVCDGEPQCQDRSDEMKCRSKSDDCVHSCDGRCLPASFVCDGEVDCLDRSDEANCEDKDEEGTSATTVLTPAAGPPKPLKCSLGSVPCRDNSDCILHDHVCDGETDCRDGSDEDDCQTECGKGQFRCTHGKKCIDQSQVCDGTPQCQDRSDEHDCNKRVDGCVHQCDNDTRCIPNSFLCDGERDCRDGSDEANCVEQACSPAEFSCSGGQCVSTTVVCDGHPDCWDGSDEESCTKAPVCNTKHRCPQSKECLVLEWICDGEQDCKDGTDEKDCPVAPLTCGDFQWACKSKTQCIPLGWRCDGTTDCSDGSDETECDAETCLPHQFKCGSQECLDPELVCNGISNCLDASDEGGSCQMKCTEADNKRCSQTCYSTPQGTRCGCAAGFKLLEDELTCEDVDECEGGMPSVCSQLCINSPGSYQCSCHPGFMMEAGASQCKATGEPFMLASIQTDLYMYGLRSGSLDVLSSSAKKAILSVDYSWREQKVYWVSLDTESIRWSSLDQKTTGTFIRGVRADSVAVDWLGKNLYWIDGVNSQIIAVRLTTASMKSNEYCIILDEDLDQPRSLALLPQKGLMFWTEIGNVVKIERAGMDGSERRAVVNSSLGWPGGVAVDTLSERLYWTDERLKAIGSTTLDGDDIWILQMKETTNPFSVAVFNDMLYWSDAKMRVVQVAHKVTGKNRLVVLKRPKQPFAVKIIHPMIQMGTENPCSKMDCSHLCVLAPQRKAVCKCPSGLLLAEDKLTCSSIVNSAFLLLLSPSTATQIYLQSRLTATDLKGWPEHLALQMPSVNEATIMDYSLRDRTLFLTDDGTTSLSSFKLKGSVLVSQGQLLKLLGDSITAMALDWLTLNIYWSSNKQPRLQVTSFTRAHTAVLVKDGIGRVESIAIHPVSGRVCFVNVDASVPTVECANMDGAERRMVWKDAVQPTSLTFSSNGETIYWADTDSGNICSVSVDGSAYKVLLSAEGLAAVALSDDTLLWMTVTDKTRLWFKDEQQKKLWFEVGTQVVGLKAFSKSSQTGSNKCTDNGNCQHLCLATPKGRTCKCAHDHVPVNGTHCSPEQRCPADSRSCLDGLSCQPVEKFCDRHVDCPDHSDENCVGPKQSSGAKVSSTRSPLSPSSSSSPLPSDPEVTEIAEVLDVTEVPDDGVQLLNLEAQQCGQKRCGGNGHCVEKDGVVSCVCSPGFSGESCQGDGLNIMQGPIMYGVAGLCAVVVIIAVIAVVVKKKNSRNSAEAVKDTSMTDLRTKVETMTSVQNAAADPEKQEEAAS